MPASIALTPGNAAVYTAVHGGSEIAPRRILFQLTPIGFHSKKGEGNERVPLFLIVRRRCAKHA